jgi:hypothetical protein
MSPIPEIRCGFGLGNRVAAMANALSRTAEIRFVWRVNQHCPLPHDEVFPDGVRGVEFVTSAPPAFATAWDGRHCYDWDAAANRFAAARAYARIMEAMAGRPWVSVRLGVVARYFRCHDSATPAGLAALAAHVAATADRLCAGRIFLLADSRREELSALLPGLQIYLPRHPELPADLDRSPEHTRTFLADWKTLLACPHIAAADGPTSLLHPARAAGRMIHYPPP